MSVDKRVILVLPFDIQVAVYGSREDCSKDFVAICGIDPFEGDNIAANGNCGYVFDDADVVWYYMVLPDDACKTTHVHEAVHLADFVMDVTGVPTGAENTEIRAYLVQDFLRNLWHSDD